MTEAVMTREKSYIEIAMFAAVAAAAIVYIWQWFTNAPVQAPAATLPGASVSQFPQAVSGRQLKVYTAI